MNGIKTRCSYINDVPALRNIWKSVFGCLGEDAFFRHFYDPELCIVAEIDNIPVAAGYLVPFGEIVQLSNTVPCAMIYSIATLPEHRGLGLGSAVVGCLVDLAHKHNYPAVVLCPVEDRLFEYYSSRTNLHDWFYVKEFLSISTPEQTHIIPPEEITIREYITKRNELLKGFIHIKHDMHVLEYQMMLCNESGGGFFRIGDSYLIVERQSHDEVWIKELLIPGGGSCSITSDEIITKTVASISSKFRAGRYVVRVPAAAGEGRRFGMLSCTETISCLSALSGTAPWYGVAFD